jgi:ferric-dicitrate binding protein FerR (iron transport regulator)
MKKEDLEKLISKYIAGKIPDTEKRDLEKWYDSFEKDEGYTNKLTGAEKDELENRLLLKIDQNIDNFERSNTNQKRTLAHSASNYISPSKNKTNIFYSYSYKIAAVLMAVIILAALSYKLLHDNTVVHSTAYGQTLHITLPDSSTVILNGNSTITYGDQWPGNGPREVYLDGEAFFSVMHNERDQKFIVNTSEQFNVEVLGTEFNVSKRKSGTRVVLNSGKVRLNIKEPEGNEQVAMKPGDLVEFKDGPADYIKKAVNAEVYSSWKDKKLILDHTSLKEILTMLEENHGLKSTVADKDLLDQKVSGSMPAEDINMLLKDIAVTYRIKILKNKDMLEIRKAPEQ